MATAALPEKISDDFIQCTICCYTFKNPKVLPCLLTFCEHCLKEWVQKNEGDTFLCPTCRQKVTLPQNGVEGLKDNFFMASLVKAVTEHDKVRHDDDDIVCTSCEEGKPATSRCSECAEFLCEFCESAHRVTRATKGHKLFTFEELKTGKYDKFFKARKAPLCPKHSGEILKLYCRTCETPICNECAWSEHRDSQHKFTRIEDVAAEKRELILDVVPQCHSQVQFFRQTEEVQKRLKENLRLNAQKSRQHVHKTVQSVIATAKEEGNRLLTCIDTEEASRNKQIDAEIEGAQISLASAKSTCEFAETLAREGGDYEVVAFSQDTTRRLNDLTKPPAETVDFELANITVDFSAMKHKLTTNSPPTAKYSLPDSTEKELSSMLKGVTQRPTNTGLSANQSKRHSTLQKVNSGVQGMTSSNPSSENKSQRVATVTDRSDPSHNRTSHSSTYRRTDNSTEEDTDEAMKETVLHQAVDPDIMSYIIKVHSSELNKIVRKHRVSFDHSKDDSTVYVKGDEDNAEQALDDFIILYQSLFSKLQSRSLDTGFHGVATGACSDAVELVDISHPSVFMKAVDGKITFIGDEQDIRSARAAVCNLLDINESRRRRRNPSANVSAASVGRQANTGPSYPQSTPRYQTDTRMQNNPGASWVKPSMYQSSSSMGQTQQTTSHTLSSFSSSGVVSASSAAANSDKDDTCPICLCDFSGPVKTTQCKHKFCADCLDTAMKVSGQCPVCKTVIGRLKGNQPVGTMTHRTDPWSILPGHLYTPGIIEIHYSFPSGTQGPEHPNPGRPYTGTSRRAYLPNNTEGREVLRLLERAFDSRLVFTIGTSATTGPTDTVVWNDIHHKTSKSGGPKRYGYPDPDYLRTVKEELAAKGIK